MDSALNTALSQSLSSQACHVSCHHCHSSCSLGVPLACCAYASMRPAITPYPREVVPLSTAHCPHALWPCVQTPHSTWPSPAMMGRCASSHWRLGQQGCSTSGPCRAQRGGCWRWRGTLWRGWWSPEPLWATCTCGMWPHLARCCASQQVKSLLGRLLCRGLAAEGPACTDLHASWTAA